MVGERTLIAVVGRVLVQEMPVFFIAYEPLNEYVKSTENLGMNSHPILSGDSYAYYTFDYIAHTGL